MRLFLGTLLIWVSLCSGVGSAWAQEIFSWWRRDLIELQLSPGAWVEFETSELSEGQQSVERIRCQVLDGGEEEDGHWISLSWPGRAEWFVMRLADQEQLRGGEILDGLLELYRMLPAGAAQEEDVSRVREDRLLRRHFQDLFEDPEVVRVALPDTTIDGRSVERELLRLNERREDRVKMGRSEVVYVQETESTAELSDAVPLFGLLRSFTHSILRTEGESRDAPPPLVTESRVRCLGFGREDPAPGLPASVVELRSGS